MIVAQHSDIGYAERLDVEESSIDILHAEGTVGEEQDEDMYPVVEAVLKIGY